MTVIVGIVDKKSKKIFVGADKGIFESDDTHYVSPEPKILKKKIGAFNGKPIYMIIGGAGDVKPWNFITPWNTSKLKFDPSVMTAHDFMLRVFTPKLKLLLEGNGYTKTKAEFAFLVGFEGQLFKIQEDYGVIIPPEYGLGIGSACIPALGVLYAFDKMKSTVSPRAKIKFAVEASINISTDAKGPIDILTV